MTLEERAACIADVSLGTARGKLRRDRIYHRALGMLEDACFQAVQEWQSTEVAKQFIEVAQRRKKIEADITRIEAEFEHPARPSKRFRL